MSGDKTFLARFKAKIYLRWSSGCWLWTGSVMPNGYGQIWFNKRRRNAHRAAYEFFKGPVPVGKEIHHLCETRRCVNPDHLTPVSHRDNIRLSDTAMGRNARKTHCKRGHELAGKNLRITKTGARQCRRCVALHSRNYRKARR